MLNPVYLYEAEILRFIAKAVYGVNLLTYASEADVFASMAKITKFPSAYYNRESIDMDFNKIYTILDGNTKVNLCPFEQTYNAYVLVENQATALDVAARLRFYWSKQPYITIKWPNPNESVQIALRLLSIKISEQRSFDDKKGAVRVVDFKWKSNLFFSEGEDGKIKTKLVEKVKIYLSKNDTIHYLADKKLIRILP